MAWTPSELIESLQKWHPDQEIEVAINRGYVILVQGLNAINLSDEEGPHAAQRTE